MKIFFRYLFVRLFVPFLVCLGACTLIWVMVDLYGNIEDFFEHKSSVLTILRFYGLQIPSMLVQVLPAALLFSTLWTLLSLNRRCELVAFQAGGMAPIWLFSPFFVFALIWMVVLAIDLDWPAPWALVTRERLLEQVKGQNARSNVFVNLPYIDKVNRQVWFFQDLDVNQNRAKGVEFLQRDADGHDMVKYYARDAKWNGEYWRLTGVREIIYAPDGSVASQRIYEVKDLDATTPPQQISLSVQQPEQLTVAQLSRYIATSTASPDYLAKYRTEWWYRVLYPFSLIVLMFFGLLQGAQTDRRHALGGVMLAILVLLCFIASTQLFLACGVHNRLPPFVAVIATEAIFGAVGLYLLGVKNGWWWQLAEMGVRRLAQWAGERGEAA